MLLSPFFIFGFPKLSSCVSVTSVWLEFWSIVVVVVASLVFLCLLLFFGASFSSLFAPSLPHHLHSNHSFTSTLFVAVS
jgi:hypothetical protein